MFSNQLIEELGLLKLVVKNNQHEVSQQTIDVVVEVETGSAEKASHTDKVELETHHEPIHEKLDKNEFRLLVNMLKAIEHDCQYDFIEYDGQSVKYKLPSMTLVFADINQADDHSTMNLSSLKDILSQPELKRPVWEKLKTLKAEPDHS
ncbi:hypothetical protein [Marinicella litoralis]|uniref:Uncharacterized protein n=1 Tax=Marinicella litoralis TaxID=644220 RepID=A0A4R6XMF6_9GAMM|nr:hypothetical protein [Marinicella litoralis]TDR20776.1 hypothetical protein C8D91_1754 [Marinicella litoralis]